MKHGSSRLPVVLALGCFPSPVGWLEAGEAPTNGVRLALRDGWAGAHPDGEVASHAASD
jgi:hypothetical protein